MIIDCFPFFNEFTQLYLRMKMLPEVDKFVLVESTTTQSGLPKRLEWQEIKGSLNWDVDLTKVVHIISDDGPSDGKTWAAENYQRNKIIDGVNILDPKDDDIILISDVDEIPILKNYKGGIRSFSMRNFYYYLNLEDARGWIGTVAVPYKEFKLKAPQYFRNIKDALPIIEPGGFHFSWLGGPEAIIKKFNSCIEPMDKSRLPSLEQIQFLFDEMRLNGKFHFIHAEDPKNSRVPLTLKPYNTIITNDIYPFVQKHIMHSYGFDKTNIQEA